MKILINYQDQTTLLHFGVVELTPTQFEIIQHANGKFMNVDEDLTEEQDNALMVVDLLMYQGTVTDDTFTHYPEETMQVLNLFKGMRATPVTDFGDLVNLAQYDALIACGWY